MNVFWTIRFALPAASIWKIIKMGDSSNIFKKSGFDAEKTVKHEILSTSSENPSVIQYLKIIYRGICSIGRMKERINGLFKIIEWKKAGKCQTTEVHTWPRGQPVVFMDTRNFGGCPAFSWAPTLLAVAHKLNCIETCISNNWMCLWITNFINFKSELGILQFQKRRSYGRNFAILGRIFHCCRKIFRKIF